MSYHWQAMTCYSSAQVRDDWGIQSPAIETILKVLADFPSGLTTQEIDQAVAKHLNLTDAQLGIIRSGNRTEFAYRLAWER